MKFEFKEKLDYTGNNTYVFGLIIPLSFVIALVDAIDSTIFSKLFKTLVEDYNWYSLLIAFVGDKFICLLYYELLGFWSV